MGNSDRRDRFEVLFASYGADIVAYCGWRAASESDAEDAVADVFLTAWRRIDHVPEGDAARVWLYATARRVMANQRRSGQRRIALADRLANEAAAARREPGSSHEEELLVHDALQRLGAHDRELLLLAEWEGLSHAQIATVIGCFPLTARGRLHRARRRFRAAFEDIRARAEADARGRDASMGLNEAPIVRAATVIHPAAGRADSKGGP
jgi:RNA polymerase sigma factor (sigma-70 family)